MIIGRDIGIRCLWIASGRDKVSKIYEIILKMRCLYMTFGVCRTGCNGRGCKVEVL